MIALNSRDRKQAKAAEYQPAAWQARRISETRILATNDATTGVLVFIAPYGRVFGCESGTSGNYYDMPAGHCSCPDAEHGAMLANRPCRHMAAWEAVSWLLEGEAQAASFRAGALNPQKFDQRVEALCREIEAEMHHYPGEPVEVAA
mgnify:CR=1 FL=1